MPHPFSVYIGEDVPFEQIAPGATIHPGCRILGDKTWIGPGCELGREQPLTIENVQLGTGVKLHGGFISNATFLDKAAMGSGAHIRPGTLLEEEASGAHTVGLKHTILMPFVTLGSLVNFCDCLMAGGTSRKQHGEVGSSYIHFNYTPHQDKATPSLIGDVPRGVMLDQAPVFLGGQGGLVGPCRIGYGNVVPAGSICRKDVLDEHKIVFCDPPDMGQARIPYDTRVYKDLTRVVINNLIYIGNLRALQQWYRHVRGRLLPADPFAQACHEGATRRLSEAVRERILRLRHLADKMPASIDLLARKEEGAMARAMASQRFFQESWPHLEVALVMEPEESLGEHDREAFLAALPAAQAAGGWPDTLAEISAEARMHGTTWLQAIVDSVSRLWHPPRTMD